MNKYAISILLLVWISLCCVSPAFPVSPFVRAWDYLTPETLRYNGAITDGQTVFVPLLRGQLLALNLATGERVWTTQIEGEWVTQLQVDAQMIYAVIGGSDQSHQVLLAFDKRDGNTLWKLAFNEPITSLTHSWEPGQPAAGRLYVGTAAGSILAIDPSSQQRIWDFHTQGAVRGRARQHENVLYVGSDDHSLYALDAAKGTPLWHFQTRGPVRAPVEIAANRIFAGSFDGSVYCLDRTTGKQHWTMRTGAAIEAKAVLRQDTLIVNSYDNFVYALAPKSGALRWKTRLPGRLTADPIAMDNVVVLAALRMHGVTVLQLDGGKEASTLTLGNTIEIVAPPVMGGNVLIITTDQGIVAARSLSAGTATITSSLSSQLRVRSALSDGI